MFNTTSGIGCTPQSKAFFIQLSSFSFNSSALEIALPEQTDVTIPEQPYSERICSVLSSSLESKPEKAQYITGTGPGKDPRASSCSLTKLLSEDKEPDKNAVLILPVVLSFSLFRFENR